MNVKLFVSMVICIFLAAEASRLLAQGALTPPGAPGATMKSLEQIDTKLEKRIPIGFLPLTINAPGAYYLTQNVTDSVGGIGITIMVSNVTIDLNGHTMTGISGSSTGIAGVVGTENIVVRNGIIEQWGGSGVSLNGSGEIVDVIFRKNTNGCSLSTGLIDRCMALENTGDGLAVTQGTIQNSVARLNGVVAFSCNAFRLEAGLIQNCVAADNVAVGINMIGRGVIQNCTVVSNTRTGISATNSSVISCVSDSNGSHGIVNGLLVKDCVLRNNVGDGIALNNPASVMGCTVSTTGAGAGIQMSAKCNATGNTVTSSSTAAIGCAGDSNRVERNQVRTITGTCISLTGTKNLVIGNSVAMTGAGVLIAPGTGNLVGTVVIAATLNTSTNPNANFNLQ